MMTQTVLRPALIARDPQPIGEGLRAYGIHVRRLLLQEGDDILPLVEPPLIVDLRGQTLSGAARLLVALQTRQRQAGLIPYLLVPRTAPAYQRLLCGLPALRSAIIADDDLASLAAWLWAPLDLLPRQVWVNLAPPVPLTLYPYLTPLMAALVGAESVSEAAQQCAISERSAYTLLRVWRREGQPRRSVAQWHMVLGQAINGD